MRISGQKWRQISGCIVASLRKHCSMNKLQLLLRATAASDIEILFTFLCAVTNAKSPDISISVVT